jgi:hypothetical protein
MIGILLPTGRLRRALDHENARCVESLGVARAQLTAPGVIGSPGEVMRMLRLRDCVKIRPVGRNLARHACVMPGWIDRAAVAPSLASCVVVRRAYAHDAVVALQPGGSANAPGGAITIALCGHWDHPPPCPLAPHYTGSFTSGEIVTLRVLFATEPTNEQRVRLLITEALAGGQSTGPDGHVTTWQLQSTAPGRVRPDEEEHAAQLIAQPCPPQT